MFAGRGNKDKRLLLSLYSIIFLSCINTFLFSFLRLSGYFEEKAKLKFLQYCSSITAATLRLPLHYALCASQNELAFSFWKNS